MALEIAQRAFGFGCGLDWRPTVFVNGIPSNRVCSACGLVPSNIALLPCRHLLCQSCYDRCASSGSRCCLDGEAILADDVLWSATSADSILARKVCTRSRRVVKRVLSRKRLSYLVTIQRL
ncbi:hypothetical protein HPB48_017227 [Haemaphysalis longicornis]|uniref:Uncharacterized protein n=1 Tax=Haemaphysalis longicornis TaxID=44386 RepID=A0A9J6GJ51_HAELO|nr:hypothetical protein HPB48_017227 [Haemaphysalis longicornis]